LGFSLIAGNSGAEAPVVVPFCPFRFWAEARSENRILTRS